MEIRYFFSEDKKEYWLEQIKKSDWNAGQFLHQLLSENKLRELCGETTEVLLLTEGDELISFCTLAEQDDVRDEAYTPWIGFVYTFPQYRGKRRVGKLLERAYKLAKDRGDKCIYISTNDTGLYEKYGYTFFQLMKDMGQEDSRVYRIEIESPDYSGVIGTEVKGLVDRPMNSTHPRHPEIIYPINYGNVEGVIAGDGEEQDVYLLGPDGPVDQYDGKVIAVYHRLNDVEDKWIVSTDDKEYSNQEILDAIAFQEQYYVGELFR